MTDLTTERVADLPDAPDRREPGPAGAPALADGVELPHFLSLARLTLPQALEIAAGVLTGTGQEPDTGSPADDLVLVGHVVIDADGRVVVVPRNGTGTAVQAVLADVATAARPGARRAGPAAEQLLARLDRAVAELPVAGVPAAGRMVEEAAAGIDREAVRAELAALVRAIGERSRAAGVTGSTGQGAAGQPRTTARPAPARPADFGESRTTKRRVGAWVLSVLALAAVVVLEVAFLRDRIASDIGLLLDAGRSGAGPSAAPTPDDGPPIAAPAPASAGNVTAVDLRPLSPCAPGATCDLRVLVRLVPAADPQVVTWSYRVVDRCTGATETVPGGSVTAPAQEDRVAVVGSVPLPAVQAVGVLAVTEVPAVAASPPVSAGSCAAPEVSGSPPEGAPDADR